MPRPRHPKSNVQHLADAIEDLATARDALYRIDLRTVPVRQGLRDKYKRARLDVEEALEAALDAIRSDAIVTMPTVRRRSASRPAPAAGRPA